MSLLACSRHGYNAPDLLARDQEKWTPVFRPITR